MKFFYWTEGDLLVGITPQLVIIENSHGWNNERRGSGDMNEIYDLLGDGFTEISTTTARKMGLPT